MCNRFVHDLGGERKKTFYPHLLEKVAYYKNSMKYFRGNV